jgi:hypothetical protein
LVAVILVTGRILPFDSTQRIEVMHLLHRRHAEIRVQSELVKKPRRSSFLGTDAQEIWASITQVIILSVSMVTYARFEWPDRTHGRIIFHRAVKNKSEPRWARALKFATVDLQNDDLSNVVRSLSFVACAHERNHPERDCNTSSLSR